jgi:hypothetical protein
MSLIFLISLLQVASAYAACSRSSLIAARDEFFQAGATKSTQGVKLAPNAKVAFNNKLTSLSSTPFTNLNGFTNLKVEAVDTDTCQIATFRVSSSQVLSTRLKVDEAGSILEVEFLQAVQGDTFFRPAGFPSTTPDLWNSKQKSGPPPKIPSTWTPIGGSPSKVVDKATCKAGAGPARLLDRRELLYIASTYADALKGEPWGSCVIGGRSCPRNENGVTTTQNCAIGAGVFNFLVRGRRWVVDTQTGVVLGAFYFDSGLGPLTDTSVGPGAPGPDNKAKNTRLFLHEYFKIEAGVLAGIYAPMKTIPAAQATTQTFEGEK